MQDVIPPRKHQYTDTQHTEVASSNYEPVHKSQLTLTVILLLVGAGAYWFGVRPYFIRKDCSQQALSHYPDGIEIDPQAVAYEGSYQACLNGKGL